MTSTQDTTMDSDSIKLDDFHAFRDCLKEVSGIILNDGKKDLVSTRLSGLISDNGLDSFTELLEKMKSDAVMRENIMDAMTANEVSWFRDSFPFDIFREKLLPEFARAQPQKVRVWSAACSTGEEPYSLSMAAEEYMQQRPDSLPANAIKILGTDISPTAVKKAKSASYEQVAVSRGLSSDKKQRYFYEEDGFWKIKNSIKRRVTINELNLRQDYKSLGLFDVIFCRNVLTYFSSEIKADIVSRLASALNPGGYLVLGKSESIADHSEYFDLVTWRDGVVYKLKS